jgi:hemoglobin
MSIETSPREESLYERVGGEEAITAAVGIFYDKLLADPLIRPFFAGLDMERQITKQISFMARAFGGPAQYQGRDLRVAHAELVRTSGLADVHFDAVARHLESTLVEIGVARPVVDEVLAVVEGTRDQVLGRSVSA